MNEEQQNTEEGTAAASPVVSEEQDADVVRYESAPQTKGSELPAIIAVIAVVAVLVLGAVFLFMRGGGTGTMSGGDGGVRFAALDANGGDCNAAYEKVLAANAFDFSVCSSSSVRTGSYEGESSSSKTKMVLVFDASGSMAGAVGGGTKMEVAKKATKSFLDEAAKDTDLEVSIVVYGHKGDNTEGAKAASCAGIEEVYAMGPVNASRAKAAIDSFSATGWTPIADSLKKAEAILKQSSGDSNIVLLVSDGEESCGGDPVETVKALRTGSAQVITSVIGFDVAGETEAELRAIAEAGSGDYFSVKSALDFEEALKKHKESLARVDFKIGRTIEQLYDMSNVLHTYNECKNMLVREEAAMMLDIHASKLVGDSCTAYADEAYERRRTNIETQIETTYRSDKAMFDQLKQ